MKVYLNLLFKLIKIFVEKYIQLAKELSDNTGEVKGNFKLGMLSANRGFL